MAVRLKCPVAGLVNFVERTADVDQLLLLYMQIPRCGVNAEMTQQILDVLDVNPLLQQMRGKTVPQTVKTDLLHDTRLPLRLLKYFLSRPYTHRLPGLRTLKQIFLRPRLAGLQVIPQDVEQ